MSAVGLFLLEDARAASVFARPRKSGELEVPDAIGDEGDGNDCAGVNVCGLCDGSECIDGDLDEMGTVKSWLVLSDVS
jgi:hypothetical protein